MKSLRLFSRFPCCDISHQNSPDSSVFQVSVFRDVSYEKSAAFFPGFRVAIYHIKTRRIPVFSRFPCCAMQRHIRKVTDFVFFQVSVLHDVMNCSILCIFEVSFCVDIIVCAHL